MKYLHHVIISYVCRLNLSQVAQFELQSYRRLILFSPLSPDGSGVHPASHPFDIMVSFRGAAVVALNCCLTLSDVKKFLESTQPHIHLIPWSPYSGVQRSERLTVALPCLLSRWFWGPPSLTSIWYRGLLLQGSSGWSVKLLPYLVWCQNVSGVHPASHPFDTMESFLRGAAVGA
jgi:hypothetical protein